MIVCLMLLGSTEVVLHSAFHIYESCIEITKDIKTDIDNEVENETEKINATNDNYNYAQSELCLTPYKIIFTTYLNSQIQYKRVCAPPPELAI